MHHMGLFSWFPVQRVQIMISGAQSTTSCKLGSEGRAYILHQPLRDILDFFYIYDGFKQNIDAFRDNNGQSKESTPPCFYRDIMINVSAIHLTSKELCHETVRDSCM